MAKAAAKEPHPPPRMATFLRFLVSATELPGTVRPLRIGEEVAWHQNSIAPHVSYGVSSDALRLLEIARK